MNIQVFNVVFKCDSSDDAKSYIIDSLKASKFEFVICYYTGYTSALFKVDSRTIDEFERVAITADNEFQIKNRKFFDCIDYIYIDYLNYVDETVSESEDESGEEVTLKRRKI